MLHRADHERVQEDPAAIVSEEANVTLCGGGAKPDHFLAHESSLQDTNDRHTDVGSSTCGCRDNATVTAMLDVETHSGEVVDNGKSLSIPCKVGAGEERGLSPAFLTGGDEGSGISLDACGIPVYTPRYTTVRSTETSQCTASYLSVPWHLRKPYRDRRCHFFDFLRLGKFWSRCFFATRVTLIGFLVPSALIAAKLPNSPFVSTTMVMSASVLASKATVGEALAYLTTWVRAGFVWLPLAVIGGVAGLGNHTAQWYVYYTCIMFLLAVFTEHMERRICLLLFNICMIGFLKNPDRGPLYPCRVMVDWCIGTGLCVVAALIPVPLFCKTTADALLKEIAKNTGTAFRGLVHSFWSTTNVERRIATAKVRLMTTTLDDLLPTFEVSQAFSLYELVFESAEVREMRELKFTLFENLRVNLSSMNRVLEMVEAKPATVDGSARSKAFGEVLTPHFCRVAKVFDELMVELVNAETRGAVLSLTGCFDKLKWEIGKLQHTYNHARRVLFYENTSSTLEEFVPLMTFYIFTVVCFRDTLEQYEVNVKLYAKSSRRTLVDFLRTTVWDPIMDNYQFVCVLFAKRNRREVQRVIEAAKVSVAMVLAVAFSFLIHIPKASLCGPSIIAFVSGSNPVEAVQASIDRLTGCLIGTVLGFFAGSFSETPVQRVASLCTLVFVGSFLRNDTEYGVMAVYAMFVLISLDSIVKTTMEETFARMNQNTFGIFIYLCISILVVPLSPGAILRKKRINVLRCMSDVLGRMMDLFSAPLSGEKNEGELTQGGPPAAYVRHEIGGVIMSSHAISNRSVHLLWHNDPPMEELDKMLLSTIKRVRGTKEMMSFACNERSLVEIDYPVKACEGVYLHMYRMTFLLKTMWRSWTVIRSQPYLTTSTRDLLQFLQPVASDISSTFARFVDLLTYTIHDPTVDLEAELTQSVLNLLTASHELHERKNQAILVIIKRSLMKYRQQMGISGAKSSCGPASDVTPSRSRSPTKISPRVRRSATFDSSFVVAKDQQWMLGFCRPHHPQVTDLNRSASITPDLQHGAKLEAGVPLSLPDDFSFPITSEDVEGLHSLALSLNVFSNEVQHLMMRMMAMLVVLRRKL